MIELHSAFMWDCDDCGAENFERGVEGDIDEAALEADENQIDAHLVAHNPELKGADDERANYESEFLIQKIVMAPGFVTCRSCKVTHPTHIASEEDDND